MRRKFSRTVRPYSRVHDLGMKLNAVDLLLRVAHRRDVQRAVEASARKPGGNDTTVSPCDIQTRDSSGTPSKSGVSRSATTRRRRPIFGMVELDELCADVARQQLHAVTDAEDRHARLDESPSIAGAPSTKRALGATGENQRSGAAQRERAPRSIVRNDLAVDAQLPRSPRDELTVLRAEIENEDGLAASTAYPAAAAAFSAAT